MREAKLSGLGGGANQAGGRAYNERLALSLIRLNGALSRAELARLTGLTAQTLSHIVKRLEDDDLVLAQAPQRGRVGQPSRPYALNPDGAFSLGVKIGRRSAEVALCDFTGTIRDRRRMAYRWPDPQATLAFVSDSIALLVASLRSGRMIGVGVAMPFELWKWADEAGAPAGALDGWRDLDVGSELERRTGLAVFTANDATAACGAELAHNPQQALVDWLYIFIGSFIGGGLVINGALYQGRTGNAGSIGSMPVMVDGQMRQLIEPASLITLEKAVTAAGGDSRLVLQPEADWSPLEPHLSAWIDQCGKAVATACVAAASVVDVEHVCIDGATPRPVLERLVASVEAHLETMDRDGLSPFGVVSGSLGADARTLGGAILPITANFSCGQDVLLKR